MEDEMEDEMEGEIKWPRFPPGQFMRRLMKELEATPQQVAAKTRLPLPCVMGILEARHAVSKREAKRLKRFFGGSAQFWLNVQDAYDEKHGAHTMSRDCADCQR